MDLRALTGDEKEVFLKLQKEGPLTKKALLERFGYKPSTLNRILASLAGRGAIAATGQEESSGGRKPYLFDIKPHEKYVIGIDISRTYIYAAVCDLKMNVRASKMIYGLPLTGYTPQNAVNSVSEAIAGLLDSFSISAADILGAGVGMVGPVDRQTGTTGEVESFRYNNWSRVPLRDMLEKALGCTVYVDNGSCAAVLAEYLYGSGKSCKSISYFNCEVGIRSASVSSGVLIRGAKDVEDAFSHTTINSEGELCYCGRRGCVRCYASTPAISENVRRRISAGEASIISAPPEAINYRHILAAAGKGDAVASEELRRAGVLFGVGLANYVTLLDPEYVIIDGPLVLESGIFFDSAVRSAKENAYASSRVVFKKGGSFGYETIAVGAAAMYFEWYMGSPIVK